MRRYGRLARKYLVILVGLVTGALLASGAVEIYSSYSENKAALVTLQREKAGGAASRIEGFVREIERQLLWTTQPLLVPTESAAIEQRRIDSVRLQRQALAITEVSHLDAGGREQLRVSRLAMDVVGSQVDFSREPKFTVPRSGRTYFGPVYFRKESEPYMTIAVPQAGGGVTVAEVNLKFIWDVVSQMKVGKAGLAYVVDGGGALIAHPDISLVLQKTSLAGLAQVKAVLADVPGDAEVTVARDLRGREVLTAHSAIASLGWVVFVEQPLEEAFQTLRASAYRTALLVALGIALAVVASAVLARRLARPVQALQVSAAKIGAGELDHQIAIGTGDELEALADEFNRMTGRLRESYATLEQKVEDRTRELTEALAQQTATAEILKVISSSPTDVQPVFDTIVRRAVGLCGGLYGVVYRFENGLVDVVAHHGVPADAVDHWVRDFPRPLRPPEQPDMLRPTLVDGETLHIRNAADDPRVSAGSLARRRGARSVGIVPIRRAGRVVGALSVSHPEVGAFTERRIVLLQTFAELGVIAIENVRLFTELEAKNRTIGEALDQQTATAEILRVISSSPTDVQPVLDAVAENATRVCEAGDGAVLLIEGRALRIAAHYGVISMPRHESIPIVRGNVAGRAILDGGPVHVEDLLAAGDDFPEGRALGMRFGNRTTLATPLLREGTPIGALLIRRTEVRPFTDKQISLLQTFADQAVIAIENVRLFQELQARTAELTRSVGELEALGEVGRTISSTLDLDTVLATIVSRANELAESDGGVIYEFDPVSRSFHLRATDRFPEELAAALRATRLTYGEGAAGRAAAARAPIQVADIVDTDAYSSSVRDALVRSGYRSLLAVPLVSEDEVVGALVINRRTPGAFAPRTVELLRTFATQSALAIQNARLFREIEDKSRELEVANQHKDEFLASMSHELRTPLNAIIGFSEVMLERMFGDLNAKQEEYLNDILSSGRHLLSLINDILDLAKIEAGRMDLDPADFHLPQAIDNALILVRERAMRRGLTLDRWIDPRLGEVKGDERKIKQVLLNLLSNAVKFTPEGGRIDVRAALAGGVAEISVADTGVGIAPEHHEAVFEEFRQVGTDYVRKHEGTGLGLTLARRFVELHGGTIRVKSQLGHGATFTFTIPVTPWQAS